MKKTTIVFALLLGSWNFLCTQVCIPNGISTNPENPINPNPPTNSPEHWLNEFEWYANDGTDLVDYVIQLEKDLAEARQQADTAQCNQEELQQRMTAMENSLQTLLQLLSTLTPKQP